jgi:hypothetical protein
MTDRADSSGRPPERNRARRPRLYRSVLRLAAVAIVAAWLPFAAFYFSALSKRVTSVTPITVPYSSPSTTRVVTTTSGTTRVLAGSQAASGTTAPGIQPVVTGAS